MFLDETGFRLQPLNRRTWAPRGVTPQQRAWDRHDRLSVISAVTLSPRRQRINVPFQMHAANIVTTDVIAFVKWLRRQLQRPLIVILDRWPVHRAAVKRLQASRMRGLDFAWLPAYAPELNPVEPRWSYTKYSDLANYVPDDVRALKIAVHRTLCKPSRNVHLKRSFFRSARLNL